MHAFTSVEVLGEESTNSDNSHLPNLNKYKLCMVLVNDGDDEEVLLSFKP